VLGHLPLQGSKQLGLQSQQQFVLRLGALAEANVHRQVNGPVLAAKGGIPNQEVQRAAYPNGAKLWNSPSGVVLRELKLCLRGRGECNFRAGKLRLSFPKQLCYNLSAVDPLRPCCHSCQKGFIARRDLFSRESLQDSSLQSLAIPTPLLQQVFRRQLGFLRSKAIQVGQATTAKKGQHLFCVHRTLLGWCKRELQGRMTSALLSL
jgi:hypothetical protein